MFTPSVLLVVVVGGHWSASFLSWLRRRAVAGTIALLEPAFRQAGQFLYRVGHDARREFASSQDRYVFAARAVPLDVVALAVLPFAVVCREALLGEPIGNRLSHASMLAGLTSRCLIQLDTCWLAH